MMQDNIDNNELSEIKELGIPLLIDFIEGKVSSDTHLAIKKYIVKYPYYEDIIEELKIELETYGSKEDILKELDKQKKANRQLIFTKQGTQKKFLTENSRTIFLLLFLVVVIFVGIGVNSFCFMDKKDKRVDNHQTDKDSIFMIDFLEFLPGIDTVIANQKLDLIDSRYLAIMDGNSKRVLITTADSLSLNNFGIIRANDSNLGSNLCDISIDDHNRIFLYDEKKRYFGKTDRIESVDINQGAYSILSNGEYIYHVPFIEGWTAMNCYVEDFVEIKGDSKNGNCDNIKVNCKNGAIAIENLISNRTSIDFLDFYSCAANNCSVFCGSNEEIYNIEKGKYILRTKFYDSEWSSVCEIKKTIHVKKNLIIEQSN